MRNIFKRQNEEVEIFANWNEVRAAQIEKEIKRMKTEELKEMLKTYALGVVIGTAVGLIIRLITAELVKRV